MKLIDAEALKAEILKAPVWTGLDAIAKINTMPHIDIVRCKECVHKGVDADDEPYCELHNMGIYADDYCSYGEREGE